MAEAIWALAGTVLGGVTAGGMTWVNTRHVERQHDRRAGEDRQREADAAGKRAEETERRACLKMAADIDEALEKLEEPLSKLGAKPASGGDGTLVDGDGQPVRWPLAWKGWYGTWEFHRDHLAASWDAESYIVMSRAYSRINELQHGLSTTGQRALSHDDFAFFRSCEAQLSEARALLKHRAPDGSGRGRPPGPRHGPA